VSRAEIQDALVRLDDLTRRLRAECPWDREQDERSIVPHTVEEAYELADAAHCGDDAKLLDELGDVLFQVHFLSLLMEERGAGDLARVANHCHDKLVRRHPHVFAPQELERAGLREARTAGEVLSNWEAIKSSEGGREAGIFGEVPHSLPGPLLARKVQRRAAATGFDLPDAQEPLAALQAGVAQLEQHAAHDADGAQLFDEVGDVLFAAVNVARKLRVDPELSLRAAAARFQARVERAQLLAAGDGASWQELDFDEQLTYYAKTLLTPEER